MPKVYYTFFLVTKTYKFDYNRAPKLKKDEYVQRHKYIYLCFEVWSQLNSNRKSYTNYLDNNIQCNLAINWVNKQEETKLRHKYVTSLIKTEIPTVWLQLV